MRLQSQPALLVWSFFTITTKSGRLASQQPKELAAFIALLKERDVSSYLEIGARQGDTFFQVMQSLPQGSRGVAVDLPFGPWGGDSRRYLETVIDDLTGYDVHVVFGDSQEVVEQVNSLGPFDAVLIDGDHRYESVKKDYQNYGDSPIVAFHDIAGDGLYCGEYKMGVPEFWREIRTNYIEFIDPSDDRPMGIGVMC